MSYWIFKIIWVPLAIIICIIAAAITAAMAKDVGWEYPYRWILIIFIVAYFADKAVNQ